MLKNTSLFLILVFTSYVNLGFSRDHRYNPNSDFLLHEGGGFAPNNKDTYAANFPSLQPSKSTVSPVITNSNSGKRDYVAPQRPSPNPTSATPKPVTNSFTTSGSTLNPPKRDYVAPQFPTLRPIVTTPKVGSIPTSKPTTVPKRDYVAPKPDAAKPMAGKVKDLVNFYDSKTQGGSVPSYSSILQGSKGNQAASTVHTPKPSTLNTVATPANKPSSGLPTKPTFTTNSLSTSRPGSAVLPSSIVNSQSQGNSNSVSDSELQVISEELLRKDVNNAAKYVTVNYQEKTTSMSKDDKAPSSLLTIGAEVWNIPTIQKFVPLLDNYERDTLVNEYVTSQERNEENAFMDAIMTTSVIRHLMNFLKDKGYVTPDPKQQRDYLKQIWFGLYSRGKGKISSSGFEHIFVSELKNGEVSGLHNWIYFSKEETANRVNYLGYLKHVEFNDKGAVLKMHFNQQGVDKPVDTMFIGTSPELEIAIYTLCYVTRVDNDCNIKLGTKNVNIITHNYRYRSKNYIGSAYPQI